MVDRGSRAIRGERHGRDLVLLDALPRRASRTLDLPGTVQNAVCQLEKTGTCAGMTNAMPLWNPHLREHPVNPYRESPEPEPQEHLIEGREECVLYGLLVVIGVIPVALALASGTELDGQATLGLMMAVWGLAGLGTLRRLRPPA